MRKDWKEKVGSAQKADQLVVCLQQLEAGIENKVRKGV